MERGVCLRDGVVLVFLLLDFWSGLQECWRLAGAVMYVCSEILQKLVWMHNGKTEEQARSPDT